MHSNTKMIRVVYTDMYEKAEHLTFTAIEDVVCTGPWGVAYHRAGFSLIKVTLHVRSLFYYSGALRNNIAWMLDREREEYASNSHQGLGIHQVGATIVALGLDSTVE